MKKDQKTVSFDAYEEGAVITALNDLRNREIDERESGDFIGDIMLKIINTPVRKVKIRDEAR
ncbi:MAG: hypothetical protein LBR98_03235 [Syntrophomonadaceae bacterium]|jgi:hypothetical protein|nr:hypothetical protein [Syntrophomonadaceae bacterium]